MKGQGQKPGQTVGGWMCPMSGHKSQEMGDQAG